MQDIGHVARPLARNHLVGIVVNDRSHLGARKDEKAHSVAAGLARFWLCHEHACESDRDIKMAGKLEDGPVGLVWIKRH